MDCTLFSSWQAARSGRPLNRVPMILLPTLTVPLNELFGLTWREPNQQIKEKFPPHVSMLYKWEFDTVVRSEKCPFSLVSWRLKHLKSNQQHYCPKPNCSLSVLTVRWGGTVNNADGKFTNKESNVISIPFHLLPVRVMVSSCILGRLQRV